MKLETSRAPSFKKQVEIKNCFLPMVRFELTETDRDELRCDLVCTVPDRDTGAPRPLHWARFMSRDMSDDEVVQDIYREVRNMLVHELAESWHVEGERIHDPHA